MESRAVRVVMGFSPFLCFLFNLNPGWIRGDVYVERRKERKKEMSAMKDVLESFAFLVGTG